MARAHVRKRLLVTHLNRIRGNRFGKLVTRPLEDGGLLGDISILHEHLPPRTRLPRIHHRRTAEFIYCTSGAMTARLGDRSYRIRAGSVILIPPGVRHQFITASSSCDAISIFNPALFIEPGADIESES